MSSSVKTTKKSAFSCEPCRRRKVKCGGEQPVCNRCVSRKDECIYKLNPTLSYTQRLEQRIKELEELVAHYHKSPPSTHPSSSHSSPPSFGSHDVLASGIRLSSDESAVARRFRGLKMDDQGNTTYHGATSFFHLPSDRNTGPNSFLPLTDNNVQRRERLVNNAWQQRVLENMSEIPEPFQHLLNVHWCWIQPLFNFVYRPAFTRDMQTMGPYYSHTLLNALLSHSVRWSKRDPPVCQILDDAYDSGAVFGKHARSLVFDEISKGISTVPTVQTLLILSAQECGYGNTVQAWTYSGLAFRLIDHLGICVDGERYIDSVPLSDEDVEIRHRLFWSCYFWDKVISLYLGRTPSIQHSAVSPPQVMFDDSAENELWVPFGVSHGPGWQYPPQRAHSASCFMSMCNLSVIFNEILIHMYDPLFQNTEEEVQECLRTQEVALQQWWDQLPPYLRIEVTLLPEFAPPSHIVTMNCFYHIFNILLHRPMLTRRGKLEADQATIMHIHLSKCVSSATAIIAIFDLYCRTFTINYCVLSLSYGVYIAATIFLLQVQASPEDHQALRRLDFCIQALDKCRFISPIIGGALNLITKELTAMGIPFHLASRAPQPTTSSASSTAPQTPLYGAPDPFQNQAMPQAFDDPGLLFQPQVDANNFNGSFATMEPAVFETMSNLEPLSAWVGTLPQFGQQ